MKNVALFSLMAGVALTSVLASASEIAVVLGEEELTQGIPGVGPLTDEQIAAWLDDEISHHLWSSLERNRYAHRRAAKQFVAIFSPTLLTCAGCWILSATDEAMKP